MFNSQFFIHLFHSETGYQINKMRQFMYRKLMDSIGFFIIVEECKTLLSYKCFDCLPPFPLLSLSSFSHFPHFFVSFTFLSYFFVSLPFLPSLSPFVCLSLSLTNKKEHTGKRLSTIVYWVDSGSFIFVYLQKFHTLTEWLNK